MAKADKTHKKAKGTAPSAAKPVKAPVKPPKPAKPPPPPPKKPVDSDSSSSDDDDDDEGRPKTAIPKKPVPSSDSSSEDSDVSVVKPAASAKPSPSKKQAVDSSSSDSSSDDDDDDKPPKLPTPKKAVSSSEEDSSEDDSDIPAVKPTASAKAPSPKKQAVDLSSDSDSSSDDEETQKPIAPKKALSSSEESSEDSDAIPAVKPVASAKAVQRPKPTTPKKATSSSEGESSDEESSEADSDVKMTNVSPTAHGGKRKAPDTSPVSTKKVKLANGNPAPTNDTSEETKSIFVGRLSWSVDNDWLAQEFSECGEVVSAHVQMDRNTGKSRGFGYVHFASAEAVEKALKLNGKEIDGRPVNIDRSSQQDKSQARDNRAKAFGDTTSPPSTTLFVGNLSFSVTEDTVWAFFNEYGVKSVRLPTDRESGRPKGFGYVEFEDLEGAKKAFEGAAGAEIEGRAIRLDYSQPRDASGGGERGGFGFGGDRGGRGRGGRGRGGDRGGRGRGGDRGGRGRGGDRGGHFRGAPRGNPRSGGFGAYEGKKTTF